MSNVEKNIMDKNGNFILTPTNLNEYIKILIAIIICFYIVYLLFINIYEFIIQS